MEELTKLDNLFKRSELSSEACECMEQWTYKGTKYYGCDARQPKCVTKGVCLGNKNGLDTAVRTCPPGEIRMEPKSNIFEKCKIRFIFAQMENCNATFLLKITIAEEILI